MANRESSPELSSLASGIMRGQAVPLDAPIEPELYNALLKSAKSLAGSVLSQDETPGQGVKMHSGNDYPIPSRLREIASDLRVLARKPVAGKYANPLEEQAAKLNEIIVDLEQTPAVVTKPGDIAKLIAREVLPMAIEDQIAEAVQHILDDNLAGTHAYEIIAETERANVETTETLIGMVAATVLAKLIQDEGGGRANVTFGPADMDQMMADYEMEAKRDGLLTVVHIKPREQARERLMSQVEDASGANPQVIPSPAKPYYFFNSRGTGRQGPMPKDEAQALVYKSVDPTATVENRMCKRAKCPNSDMQGSCPACAIV